MKKLLIILSFFIFTNTSAQYGMLNGTGYAPNVTVVDLNGVTHDIYEYLDSGYVVVLELVSASCATCASYASGTENSYNLYGPGGNNSAKFIGLETNSNTTNTMVSNFASTYGITFPIANNIVPANINYQLYYTPSYYVIYPDTSYTTICPLYCVTTSTSSSIENDLNNAISSWVISGCTDSTATNYYPGANVDDGSCTYSTACSGSPITNLGVTNIIHDRATFTFDDMNSSTCRVDQLRIKYREVGTSTWSQKNMGSPTGYDPVTGICNSTSRTDKLVLGLSANTTYEWQMRVWYCSTGATAWVNGPNFTTLADCPNVGNLAVTTPNSTKATFTWDNSNGAYSFVRLQARVDTTGSSFFNIGGVGVPYGTYTKDKNGLVPGTSYRAKSRTWCDPNGGAYKAPSWTSFIYFTMPGSIRLDGGTSIESLDVYPNPSRDIFNVSFTSKEAQDLEVRVINVVGEVVYTEGLENFTGEYTKEIDLVKYTKGIYFLEITTNSGVINKKLILQ